MRLIDTAYIDGAFVPVTGEEELQIINPANERTIGSLRVASREDARRAIAVAHRAQEGLAKTAKAERLDMLTSLQDAILRRSDDIRDVTIEEYGAPVSRARWISRYASDCFGYAAEALRDYDFERRIGDATVRMEPVGVSALIAPWNAVSGTICSKLASALAGGCATVIKPSELSGLQSQVVAEALHGAGLPAGTFNIVNGRGKDVGDELSTNPDVARISFTGSTATGKIIARAAAETIKRVGLSLSGKSATIIMEDADLATAVPMALDGGFQNNGQACIAGTRILVPADRLNDVYALVRPAMARLKVGLPSDPNTAIGPLASAAQYERIQRFIARGLEQGAKLLAGGLGKPYGLDTGFFVKPTVFAEVSNDMDIAREEIFGPVLSIIPFRDEEDAIRIANDSAYGLEAYVYSIDPHRARCVADRLHTGSVLINQIAPDLRAPFGGVKQSGIGREFGHFGLEAFLEAKSIAGHYTRV
ncbi:3-succinoylsemialdehyde-pyridine dehydrogenase [Hartmannibacter diazotrophicus]|uniref:aldehyde dehydrogenase (NAD(+)) n=1 Tax=Hartmannibacter diazotrophicus TaxID=1482074 RepID=A0A2C9D5E2_9HYPH|nr:aldehyde dehydrogenase family protein [Hartmannibacter diazotrophicus]SON55410.1 3-succinoylsemialdehyde-pyridine dehydrogenase [Hartmannibacter diazotrophicus]